MKKKMESGMPEHEKMAKMKVLQQLMEEAQNEMGGKMSGLKKVSVMSDSAEGLKSGLQKAQTMLPNMDGGNSEEPNPKPYEEESPDHPLETGELHNAGAEQHEKEEMMDADQLDQEIQRLMAIKDSLKSKHPGM